MTAAATLTPAELAAELNTDARTARKFLRSITPKDEQPGKGSRWALKGTKTAIAGYRKQFAAFQAAQDEAKAKREFAKADAEAKAADTAAEALEAPATDEAPELEGPSDDDIAAISDEALDIELDD